MQFAFHNYKYIKKFFGKISILSKVWKWSKQQGAGGLCSLGHYDAMRSKIDMWFTPNSCTLWNIMTCFAKIINPDWDSAKNYALDV